MRYPIAMTKVLITVPDELLQRIDLEAKARRLTRSRFMEEASRRDLGSPGSDVIQAAVERSRQALAGVGEFESSDLIRRDREARDAADR
jgi:predicted transcriptional regulator